MSNHKKVIFHVSGKSTSPLDVPTDHSSPLRPTVQSRTILKRTSSITRNSQDSGSFGNIKTEPSVVLTTDSRVPTEPRELRILTEPRNSPSPNRKDSNIIVVPCNDSPVFGISRENTSTEKKRVAHVKTKSTILEQKLPLIRASPSRENQPRSKVPMRTRREGGTGGDYRNAVTAIPTNSTMSLIEKARQKVMERYVNKPGQSMEAGIAKEKQGNLMTWIDSVKDDLFKDKRQMQTYIHQHSQNMDLLEQKHYDSFI